MVAAGYRNCRGIYGVPISVYSFIRVVVQLITNESVCFGVMVVEGLSTCDRMYYLYWILCVNTYGHGSLDVGHWMDSAYERRLGFTTLVRLTWEWECIRIYCKNTCWYNFVFFRVYNMALWNECMAYHSQKIYVHFGTVPGSQSIHF